MEGEEIVNRKMDWKTDLFQYLGEQPNIPGNSERMGKFHSGNPYGLLIGNRPHLSQENDHKSESKVVY